MWLFRYFTKKTAKVLSLYQTSGTEEGGTNRAGTLTTYCLAVNYLAEIIPTVVVIGEA